MKKNKIILLLSIVLVFIGLFFIVSRLNMVNKENEIIINNKEADFKKENSKIRTISEEKALGIFINKEKDNISYYSAENGNVIEIDPDGRNRKIISNIQISGISKVIRSSSGIESILKIGDDYFYHNIENNSKKSLGKGIDNVAWFYNGEKIIFKSFDAESKKRTINISDPSGENVELIVETELRDVEISQVPKNNIISIWNRPMSSEKTSLEFIFPDIKEKRKIFSLKNGADFKWCPDGEKALITFVKKESGQSLSSGIVKRDGSFLEIGMPTIASKTVWGYDGKTIYYAAPNFPKGSVIPDDYEQKKALTKDFFWKVDIESGQKERLIEIGDINMEIDATELNIASNGRGLIFINRIDGMVYRLDF